MARIASEHSSPQPPASAGKPGGQLPASVRYARRLLWLQGTIWALFAIDGAAFTVTVLIEVLAGHRSWGSMAAQLGLLPVAALLSGSFAVTKIRLALRLAHGRERTRKMVIGVELAMTCLGFVITAAVDPSGGMPAGSVGLAALVGGGLSLAAALGLLRRRARQYFFDSGAAAPPAADSTGGGGNTASSGRPPVRRRWALTPLMRAVPASPA